ncbi:MAG: glutamate racemase [Hyphomicrobiaceae bacterium]|nr:glutamate racemase [Hyphomicrobiaceae bacterium]
MTVPRILVFDSGLGGLTVYREFLGKMPDASYLYVADNAVFPYGDLRDEELVIRLLALFDVLIEREQPDLCVIACNTASTIALVPLREHFEVPFVGTVPAIKTAGEKTRSGLFSLLATPGTVKRRYTRDLVERFASHCHVTLVGAECLAELAEDFMRGKAIDRERLAHILKPAFIEHQGARTDIIVLGCTHYPLLIDEMRKVEPWPVSYIDPAPAIAKQGQVVLQRLFGENLNANEERAANRLIYTGNDGIVINIGDYLSNIGLHETSRDEIIG